MRQDAFRSTPVVGVEDGSFHKDISREALLVAVLLKDLKIQDVKIAKITVDGLDATEKLVRILSGWKFAAIFLAGVSFAGFNVIDPMVIHRRLRKPIIVVTRTKPNSKAVKRALQKHFEDWRIRWQAFENLEAPRKVIVSAGEPPIYVETVDASFKFVCNLVRSLSVCSRVPEPLRVARLIARGLS